VEFSVLLVEFNVLFVEFDVTLIVLNKMLVPVGPLRSAALQVKANMVMPITATNMAFFIMPFLQRAHSA